MALAEGTFTVSWTAVAGADLYEAQRRVSGEDEWTALPATTSTSATYAPAGGPLCGTTYEFRARSNGDGVVYVDGWGPESGPESVTTEACNHPPAFDDAPYAFTVAEDAAVNDAVGTVTATDPDEGDTLRYAIIAGSSNFAIGAATGAITVRGTLDYETTSSYTLRVVAIDPSGQAAVAVVVITVTDVGDEEEL